MSFSTLTANQVRLSAAGRALGVSASYPVYALDPDAVAWLTAASIANDPAAFYDVGVYRRSGAQIWTAGDQRIKSLKLAGLWQLLAFDLPFAGATAAAHSIDTRRPTVPATLILDPNNPAPTFSGGFNGNQGGWFDVHVRPSDLPQDNCGISIYSRMERNALEMPLGAADAGLNNSLYLLPSFSNFNYSRINQADSNPLSNAYSLGTQMATRSGPMTRSYYNRGVRVAEDMVASVTPSTSSFYIGACNVGGEAMFKAAYLMGSAQGWLVALNQQQADAFTDIEEPWQTALGRNV
jgi:hypothetical protein